MSPEGSDEGDRPPFVVPEVDCRNADTWNPTNARLIRVARDPDALVRYYRELNAMDVAVRKHELDFQETGEPIAADDARELAMQMKALYFDEIFIGLDDWRAFLTGRCLTLKKADGQVHCGEFISATVRLESNHLDHPVWPPFTFAFPAELESAFGVQTLAWLNAHIETVSREFAARTFGEPDSRGGNFGFVLNRSRSPSPEPVSILVVPAPIEGPIAEFTTPVVETLDHWEALAGAADILLRCRQPLGGALGEWVVAALKGRSARPDRRKFKQGVKDELRNISIIESIRALERCGMKAIYSDRAPGPASNVIGNVLHRSPATVLDIWKKRSN